MADRTVWGVGGQTARGSTRLEKNCVQTQTTTTLISQRHKDATRYYYYNCTGFFSHKLRNARETPSTRREKTTNGASNNNIIIIIILITIRLANPIDTATAPQRGSVRDERTRLQVDARQAIRRTDNAASGQVSSPDLHRRAAWRLRV